MIDPGFKSSKAVASPGGATAASSIAFTRASATRIRFAVAVACFLAALACVSCDDRSSSDRPSVILISIDTLRADHIHGYGYERETSPALDGLMRRGASFPTTISSAPWTLPSHISLITSLYPHSHGVISELLALNESVETLPLLLKGAGYETAGFTTMPHLSPRHGFGRGFDAYMCEEIPAPAALERALRWLDGAGPENFFVFIHLFDVHSDYDPSERFLKMFEEPYSGDIDGSGKTLYKARNGELELSEEDLRRLITLYDAGIRELDNNIGLFLGALESRGLLEGAIVVVTSDHGEEFLDHGGVLHGQTLYDELVRVPLIMAGPGVPEGLSVEKQVEAIDIMPTILELCGVEIPSEAEGRSLVPLLRGNSSDWTELAFSEADWRNRKHDIKRAVRTGRHKLYYDRLTGSEELYDLVADPGEKRNIIAANPEIAERLRKQLKEWMGAERGKPARIKLNEKERERLQALGYLN